jgi:hypothetical protein
MLVNGLLQLQSRPMRMPMNECSMEHMRLLKFHAQEALIRRFPKIFDVYAWLELERSAPERVFDLPFVFDEPLVYNKPGKVRPGRKSGSRSFEIGAEMSTMESRHWLSIVALCRLEYEDFEAAKKSGLLEDGYRLKA